MSAVAIGVFMVYAGAIICSIMFGVYCVTLGLAIIAPLVGWVAAELESRW